MNAYSLPKGTISRVLVASGMTRHDCLLQRFIADDIKYINLLEKNLTFSLSNNLRTRKEGLLDSFVLLDQEDSLAGLTLMAHVRMHSNERHPNLPKRPPFDPDTYIKNKLANAKTPYDPDDYAW